MKIAALQKFSLIDMPEYISAVIYTQGCNMQCDYCHNPEHQNVDASGQVEWYEIQEYLVKRKNLLEAVVFSGGEPTIQEDLFEKICECKLLGYKIGLHTNGCGESFSKCAKLCDYILLSHASKIKIDIAMEATRLDLSEVKKETDGAWKNHILHIK